MAVLQNRGRVAIARAVAALPIYLAWGRGLAAWDDVPDPEPTTANALVDEIGRRLATSVQFAEPNPDGEIELPDQSRYSVSAVETKWLYVTWVFNYADAAGETVRELGVFLGGSLVPGLPAGLRYFTPDQVVERGDLYTLERFEKYNRSGSTRQVQAFVLPF